MAFYFLLNFNPSIYKTYFAESIEATIEQGGDTDTNACIAGGMVGAILGIHNLDYKMVKKVLEKPLGEELR